MTFDQLTDQLTLLTAGTFIVGIILLWLSTRLFRRSRGANYWIYRRQAGRRGFRILILAVGCLSLSAALCVTTFLFDTLEEEDAETPVVVNPTGTFVTLTVEVFPTSAPTLEPTLDLTTPIPSATATSISVASATATATASMTNTAEVTVDEGTQVGLAVPSTAVEDTATSTIAVTASSTRPRSSATATSTLTATASFTPTRSATSTATLTVTASPTASLTASPTATPEVPTMTPTPSPFPTRVSLLLPITPRARARPDATLSITAISTTITDEWEPENPAESFSTGFSRVYFFIEFENMTTGVLWQWRLFKDGDYVDGQPALWGNQTAGNTLFFYGREAGFTPGEYEIQLYVDDEQVDTATFTVTP